MPSTRRPYRLSPLPCAVTYRVGLFQGHGTLWNFSLNGCKLSGDLPLRVGQTCSLTINFSKQTNIVVAAAIVRWVRGQEYGVETLVVEKPMHNRLKRLVNRLVQESRKIIP